MKLEKYTLYQLSIITAIMLSILLSLLVWHLLIFVFPLITIAGVILILIFRKKGHLDDERTIKISEKASEKTIIVFVFSTLLLLVIGMLFSGLYPDLSFSGGSLQLLLDLFQKMFWGTIILSVIYLVFYVYYRYVYGGVLR